MIGIIHRYFTEQILKDCGLPEHYVLWSNSPDEDIYSGHRYRYHKLSSFNEIYDLCIEKYDMRKALNTKIISLVILGHLYLDMLVGPVKVFDGLNITVHRKLMEYIDNIGYEKTMDIIYKIVSDPPKPYIEDMRKLFTDMDITQPDILSKSLFLRLKEETIGYFDSNKFKEPDINNIYYPYNRTRLFENDFYHIFSSLI